MIHGRRKHLNQRTFLNIVWNYEYVCTYWRDGLIVSLFKKRDREVPGNYRGLTLLSVIGKLYSRVINNRQLTYTYLELNNKLHEGKGVLE